MARKPPVKVKVRRGQGISANIKLNAVDTARVLERLANPPEPTPALRALFRDAPDPDWVAALDLTLAALGPTAPVTTDDCAVIHKRLRGALPAGAVIEVYHQNAGSTLVVSAQCGTESAKRRMRL